jgi:two-component system alkaline phosphatase synthesis response regulator PhoP
MRVTKQGVKIIIIDDDESVRAVLRVALNRRKFIVEEACNGKEGLEKIKKNKPDIIILDGIMPVMDGIQTCRILKGNPETRKIPVIFCSATHIKSIKESKIKADEYIEKPFSFEVLYEKIMKAIFITYRV